MYLFPFFTITLKIHVTKTKTFFFLVLFLIIIYQLLDKEAAYRCMSASVKRGTNLNCVLLSSLSSSSLRYQLISGLGPARSWHSNTSLFPSSSCLSWGFCVKLGAKSSATPIVLAVCHYWRGKTAVAGKTCIKHIL